MIIYEFQNQNFQWRFGPSFSSTILSSESRFAMKEFVNWSSNNTLNLGQYLCWFSRIQTVPLRRALSMYYVNVAVSATHGWKRTKWPTGYGQMYFDIHPFCRKLNGRQTLRNVENWEGKFGKFGISHSYFWSSFTIWFILTFPAFISWLMGKKISWFLQHGVTVKISLIYRFHSLFIWTVWLQTNFQAHLQILLLYW